MSRPCAVRARGLTKTFDDVVALDGVDLDVAAGRIHGVVGPNGAGKTTLFGLLLGLAAADGGSLEILGEPAGRGRPAPEGVTGFVDGPGLYPALTARKNLAALAALRGPRGSGSAGTPPTAVDDVLDEVGLAEVADDKVRGFSLGMRQRLGLAAALLARPRLLVLDEPANGLDPAGKQHVHDTLARLAADGTTVVLSSHRMDDLAAMCSEVTILSTGRVVFTGPLAKLAAGNRELDYRLRTSDPAAARRVAAGTDAVTVTGGTGPGADPETIVIQAPVPALDELVPRLVHAGIAVRELAPVVSPLETAFLALTEQPGQREQA
ncbi:MAG: ABC transporter ATP-binding protein [Nocardiopsaceae bacterium]|nr:ABC transporter ATP-binding protein [Nocardiopsaceae bacterium]